jgi:hypothetical protein
MENQEVEMEVKEKGEQSRNRKQKLNEKNGV